MAIKRHILIIDVRATVFPILCPSSLGCYFEGQEKNLAEDVVLKEPGLYCTLKIGTERQVAVPDVVFDVSTLVVIHDGSAHYWCTRPSISSCKRAGSSIRGWFFYQEEAEEHFASLVQKCQLPILKLITPA